MNAPVRRVPRLTPEMRLKIKFESGCNTIRELLDKGKIWSAKQEAKALVLEINRRCPDRELQRQYYDQIRKLGGGYISVYDILEEHRYKSEARRMRERLKRGVDPRIVHG